MMQSLKILSALALSAFLIACDQQGTEPSSPAPTNTAPDSVETPDIGTPDAASDPLLALIDEALADPRRPEDDKAQDANRKPGAVIAHAGTKPGDVVADIGAASGYYTQILSAVVGETGKVYAFNPKRFERFFGGKDPLEPIVAAYGNVVGSMAPFPEMSFPEPLDSAYLILLYHDTLIEDFGIDAATLNALVFDALKPGGIYVIVDHKAEENTGLRDTATLHRIDAQTVKEGLMDAGFEFVGESDALAHPADDKTKNVFDPTVRRKTDRLIFTFRKPE